MSHIHIFIYIYEYPSPVLSLSLSLLYGSWKGCPSLGTWGNQRDAATHISTIHLFPIFVADSESGLWWMAVYVPCKTAAILPMSGASGARLSKVTKHSRIRYGKSGGICSLPACEATANKIMPAKKVRRAENQVPPCLWL